MAEMIRIMKGLPILRHNLKFILSVYTFYITGSILNPPTFPHYPDGWDILNDTTTEQQPKKPVPELHEGKTFVHCYTKLQKQCPLHCRP